MIHESLAACQEQIKLWKHEGISMEHIKERLLQQGFTEELAAEALNDWSKAHYARKRSEGMRWCCIGGGLLISSFLITLILFNTDHRFAIFLYGFTIAGIGMLLKGMVDLLGW